MQTDNNPDPVSPRLAARDYRKAMLELITLEDWREILSRLVQAAKGGDMTAIRMIAERVVGPNPVGEWPAPEDVDLEEREAKSNNRMRAVMQDIAERHP